MSDMEAGADRVLLVTGASSGIGEATARMAAGRGWRVALAARSADRLEALAAELGGAERALAVPCDVTDEAAQRAMFERVAGAFGRIDAVLVNAGRGVTSNDADDWRGMIELNVLGAVLTTKLAVEPLKASGGHLVILGSAAGRRPIPGSVYGVTKWAMTGLGYNMRETLKGEGVRSTLIEPGMVDTPFFDEPKPDALKPQDVAESILFALSMPARANVNEIWLMPREA